MRWYKVLSIVEPMRKIRRHEQNTLAEISFGDDETGVQDVRLRWILLAGKVTLLLEVFDDSFGILSMHDVISYLQTLEGHNPPTVQSVAERLSILGFVNLTHLLLS